MHTADAIVIGAGHNGLVAANLLADEGWDVVVLEEQPVPGGALRTEEITAPGFRSDLCAAFFPLGAASPVLRGLDLTEHGLRWLHAPDALAHVFPDDRCAVLSRDLDRTAESIAQFAPGDARSWRELFSQWQGFRDEFLDALFTPFPPVRAGARFLRRTGTVEVLRLARMLTLPARRFARERFEGEGARLLLSGNAAHSDISVDNAGSAVFGWLLGMLAQDVGFPVPEGGASELVAALVRRLRSKGGSVHCGTPVTEVLVARGKAVGVRCADGEPIRARKAVLADVTAETLYGKLVAPRWLPSRLLADLRVFEWDSATVKLDWALSEPIPWTAKDARGAGTVHLGCDEDGLSAFGAELARDRVPEQPFLLLGQMTTADSTRSPAGTESVWAYTHVPRGSDRDTVRRQAERIEATVERNAPGFRDLILARRVQGPADLADHDANLVGGAINGGTARLRQQLFLRPPGGFGRPETGIAGLYLASASAHPGGGVHGGPGHIAAEVALRRSSAAPGRGA